MYQTFKLYTVAERNGKPKYPNGTNRAAYVCIAAAGRTAQPARPYLLHVASSVGKDVTG